MKKPALILIPRIFKPINRQFYYDACKKLVKDEGFIPVNLLFYDDYLRLTNIQYISEIEPVIESIFIFTDFGIDKLLNLVSKKFPRKIVYKKFLDEEIPIITNELEYILEETIVRAREFFNIDASIELLKSKSRKREIILSRAFFYKRAKEKTKFSLNKIGYLIGGKNHATVLNGIKRVNNEVGLIDEYKKFWGEYKDSEKNKNYNDIISELEMRKPPLNAFKSPFENIQPSNNRGYSGYRPHLP